MTLNLKSIFKILIFVIIFLIIDYISTKFLFSKILIQNLENVYSQDLKNRVPNKNYKYTFKKNVEFYSNYKKKIYKINTNDLGFRDNLSKDLDRSKNYIILMGDSFVEGVGLNYDETIGYKMNKKIGKKIFLNGGVSSYSTYIYNKKIKTILKKNKDLKIKKVLLFLDKSDPIDDFYNNYYDLPNTFSLVNDKPKYRKDFSESFTSLLFLKKTNNFLEESLRSLKYRFQLAKISKKNFFSFSENQVNAFKSIGNRQFISEWYTNTNKWNEETKKKLIFSINQIEDLQQFLEPLNIDLVIVLFPWAYELYNKNLGENYYKFMTNKFAKINIKTINCYKNFQKNNILDQLEFIGQKFQFADIHYNNGGNEIFSNCIMKYLDLN